MLLTASMLFRASRSLLRSTPGSSRVLHSATSALLSDGRSYDASLSTFSRRTFAVEFPTGSPQGKPDEAQPEQEKKRQELQPEEALGLDAVAQIAQREAEHSSLRPVEGSALLADDDHHQNHKYKVRKGRRPRRAAPMLHAAAACMAHCNMHCRARSVVHTHVAWLRHTAMPQTRGPELHPLQLLSAHAVAMSSFMRAP